VKGFDIGISLNSVLNSYGDEGWELTHCDLDQQAFIFKRPKDIAIRELSSNDEAGIRKVIEDYFGGEVG
jgi:hypothetical protein